MTPPPPLHVPSVRTAPTRCSIMTLNIPLIIMSRHAAYQCPMPKSIYDDMAHTGHAIGRRLRDAQRDSIESLWKRACAPEGPARLGLPARCDKQWFRSTFLDGAGDGRNAEDSIWDLVTSFMMYDPMTLMACLPATRHFFRPTTKLVDDTTHNIIGRSAEDPGISDNHVEDLTDFLYTSFFKGLTMEFSEFVHTKGVAETPSELLARRKRFDSKSNNEEMSGAESTKVSQTTESAQAPSKGSKVTPLMSWCSCCVETKPHRQTKKSLKALLATGTAKTYNARTC